MSTTTSTTPIAIVGIDIGTTSTKVVLGENSSSIHGSLLEIVRNDVGGHTTPTIVSFADSASPRTMGATANARPSKDTIIHLNRLLSDEILAQSDELAAFYLTSFDVESNMVHNLEYNQESEPKSFSTSALLAMLLGKIQSNVHATWERCFAKASNDTAAPTTTTTTTTTPDVHYQYVFTCPPDMSSTAQQQLLDAAYAAGMDDILLLDRSYAYQATYARKFPEHLDKYVMIVDMGHAETTVSILGPSTTNNENVEKAAEDSSNNNNNNDDDDDATKPNATSVVLASLRQKGLGAGIVDARLWKHYAELQKTKQPSLAPKSKSGQRLLSGVSKLKHLLSQLPQANVTVEYETADVPLEGSRNLVLDLCQDVKAELTQLLQQAMTVAGIQSSDQLFAVEVVGGGCRMPWVKDVIESVTVSSSSATTGPSTLSYSLDDTSAAFGAALVLMGVDTSTNGQDEGVVEVSGTLKRWDAKQNEPTDLQVSLRQAEQAMAAVDAEHQQRADLLNQMEAYILEMRSAKHHVQHGGLISDDLFVYLDQLEDWLFSPDVLTMSKNDIQTKWDEAKAEIANRASAYLEAIEADKKSKEAEMEAEAALAQKERDGDENGGPGDDDDDHDNRRLPKKRRMEIVLKNKNEGGELFSDGNYKFAAARYAKALSHCAKFVDLSPDDVAEVNAVKLTLNMNLGLAWLKMQNPDQALRFCNDALALDATNSKALYRRASVYYEKKNWDAANKDLKKAAANAPDDKAIKKLQEKVDAQLKREKAKQKKMAQKMFG